jgi:hypothetical protein
MRTFAPGDTFWTIEVDCSEPLRIVKLFFVAIDEKVTAEHEGHPILGGNWIVAVDHPTNYQRARAVRDLCNEHHGAFTTEEAASAELERRRAAYADSPEWQEEAAYSRRRFYELPDENRSLSLQFEEYPYPELW